MTGAQAREGARDAGLKRSIGTVGLIFAAINITVGAGIFTLPAGMARTAGPYALIAYLACVAATAAVVLCCAEAGSRVPTSGGIYGYVDAAFGPMPGFVAAVLLWLGCVLANGAISAAVADAVAHVWPVLGAPVPRAVLILAMQGALAGLNLLGAGAAARAISWATVVKLVPLAIFVGVGVFFIQPHRLTEGVLPSVGGIGRGVILSMFAFQGVETVLAANGEVRDPGRTLPRALVVAMGFVAVLYILIQVVAQGLMGRDLAGSAAPLADAMGRVDPRLGGLLLGGAALSMFLGIASDFLGAPRVLFALARDGFLPKALGSLTPRTQVPTVAILVHAATAFLLAVSGTFEQLIVLSSLSTCLLYLGACLAAWRLARRKVAQLGEPFGLRGIGAWAMFGAVSMVAIIALGRPIEIGALILTVAVSCGLYVLARRKPAAA